MSPPGSWYSDTESPEVVNDLKKQPKKKRASQKDNTMFKRDATAQTSNQFIDWNAGSDEHIADDNNDDWGNVENNIQKTDFDHWGARAVHDKSYAKNADTNQSPEHRVRIELGLKCLVHDGVGWGSVPLECNCAANNDQLVFEGDRDAVMVQGVIKHEKRVQEQASFVAAAQSTGKGTSLPDNDTIYTPPETIVNDEPASADPVDSKEVSNEKDFSTALVAISCAVVQIEKLESELNHTKLQLNAHLQHGLSSLDWPYCRDSFSGLSISLKSKAAIQNIQPVIKMALKELSESATTLNSAAQPFLQDLVGMIDLDKESEDFDKIQVGNSMKVGMSKKLDDSKKAYSSKEVDVGATTFDDW